MNIPARPAPRNARGLVSAGPIHPTIVNRRRQAACQWRIDHHDDPARESCWQAFRIGATWGIRNAIEIRSILLGLAQAEVQVPFDEPTEEKKDA